MEFKVENVTNLIKILTWPKLVQVGVFMIMLGLGYGFWENRTMVYNSLRVGARVELSSPVILTPSPAIKKTIDSTLEKAKDTIVAFQIVNVDFKKNVKSTAYFSSQDETLNKLFNSYTENKLHELPLFTDKESSNQRVIDLINGEFFCSDYSETMDPSVFGKEQSRIASVCSISIPPYYGRFSGYLNIYLRKKPTEEDAIYIRLIARDISLKIFESDIDKSIKYQLN